MPLGPRSHDEHGRKLVRRRGTRGSGPTCAPRLPHYGSLWCYLLVCLLVSSGITRVCALPVAQNDSHTTTPSRATVATATATTAHASAGATISGNLAPTASSSHGSALAASTTTHVPGTVVTDSPLVRTKSSSSLESIFSLSSNQSSFAPSLLASPSLPASSFTQSPTIYPSPKSDGNDDDDNSGTTSDSTYNSLVNFYFLILAGAVAAALVAWWYWRRRRKGKNMRDRRRGLEALRRDLELGRLRRGFLGVVGRGGSNQSQNSAEELPAYQAVRAPHSTLTRPPGYSETVSRDLEVSNSGLHTIEEEGSIASRPRTPEVANATRPADEPPSDPPVPAKDVGEEH